ncbi:MAG: type IV pilus assembly protein PilM [Acidobacteriota bacterium]
MFLANWFRPKPRGLVGVDIGSSSVKIAELKKTGTSYRVEALGKADLPPDTIVDGAIIAKLPVAEAVESLFQRKRIRNSRVATSISGHSVIVKKVALPALTEQELAQSIQWEAEQYIPFDLAEVNVDYQVVEQTPGEQKLKVILVAAKKDKIADYTGVLSMAGKTVAVVDIDAFALQNVYEVNYQPEATSVAALLDVGASSTNINIVRGTEFLFTRDIAIGGNQYTEFIQEELGVSREEAEACKTGSADITPEQAEAVDRILRSVSENLVLEIEKTLDYFKTTTYAEDIQQMLLSGGAGKTRGLRDFLRESFQFPVEYLDPFRRIQGADRSALGDDPESAGTDFAIAVGLALRTA